MHRSVPESSKGLLSHDGRFSHSLFFGIGKVAKLCFLKSNDDGDSRKNFFIKMNDLKALNNSNIGEFSGS